MKAPGPGSSTGLSTGPSPQVATVLQSLEKDKVGSCSKACVTLARQTLRGHNQTDSALRQVYRRASVQLNPSLWPLMRVALYFFGHPPAEDEAPRLVGALQLFSEMGIVLKDIKLWQLAFSYTPDQVIDALASPEPLTEYGETLLTLIFVYRAPDLRTHDRFGEIALKRMVAYCSVEQDKITEKQLLSDIVAYVQKLPKSERTNALQALLPLSRLQYSVIQEKLGKSGLEVPQYCVSASERLRGCEAVKLPGGCSSGEIDENIQSETRKVFWQLEVPKGRRTSGVWDSPRFTASIGQGVLRLRRTVERGQTKTELTLFGDFRDCEVTTNLRGDRKWTWRILHHGSGRLTGIPLNTICPSVVEVTLTFADAKPILVSPKMTGCTQFDSVLATLHEARDEKRIFTRNTTRLSSFNTKITESSSMLCPEKAIPGVGIVVPHLFLSDRLLNCGHSSWIQVLATAEGAEEYPPISTLQDFPRMSQVTQNMMQGAIAASRAIGEDPENIVKRFAEWFKKAPASERKNAGQLLEALELENSRANHLLSRYGLMGSGYRYRKEPKKVD